MYWESYRIISREELKELEEKSDVLLPDDYKEWIMQNGLSVPKTDRDEHACGFISDDDQPYIVDYFYEPDHIVYYVKSLFIDEPDLKGRFVPFAKDPGNNWFAFYYKEGKPYVVFNYYGIHPAGILENEEETVQILTNSFTDFIDRIKEFKLI